jgi:hypothetical protein
LDRKTSSPQKNMLEESLLNEKEAESLIKKELESDADSMESDSLLTDEQMKQKRIQFVKLKMDYKLLK